MNRNKKAIIIVIIILICILAVFLVINGIKHVKEQKNKKEINLQDNEYMHVELDSNGDKVPVPNGYVGSHVTGENEINTGFVIYEGEEEVTDSNVTDAQKTRNQYVWIPVPDASKIYGTDKYGKKWGKTYGFTTGTKEDMDKKNINKEDVDELTGAYPDNWKEYIIGVMKIIDRKGTREPGVVLKYTAFLERTTYLDVPERLQKLDLGARTTDEFLEQMEQEFNNMIESVEKYGGFYIGRYETGDLSQDIAVVKKGNIDISSQDWYMMYKKCKTLKGKNTNLETGMIWGNQFDRTLMWLIESGNKTKEKIAGNSTSWGNYSNNKIKYLNSSGNAEWKYHKEKIPTGSAELTKANNIYDLAGNVCDWTMEAKDNEYRISRGGRYDISGAVYPASIYEANHPTNNRDFYGCRAMLYIKQ